MTGSLQIKNNKYYIVLNIYRKGKRKVGLAQALSMKIPGEQDNPALPSVPTAS